MIDGAVAVDLPTVVVVGSVVGIRVQVDKRRRHHSSLERDAQQPHNHGRNAKFHGKLTVPHDRGTGQHGPPAPYGRQSTTKL
jgi:hypothetical protein